MNWETIKLGDIAKIQTGKSNKEDAVPDGKYVFFDRSKYIQRSDRFLLDTEAVIVPGEGSEFIPRYFNGPFDFHQRVYAITDFQGVDGRFLYYAMSHKRKYFAQVAIGATVKSLRKGMFERFTFSCPPMTEQKRISAILSAYDDLIENNRRRIELLEKAARLIYEEWFIRLRFPGHENIKIVDGVPAGWRDYGMMEHPYFEFIRENITPFDGTRRYHATADVSGIFITGKGIDYTFDDKPSRAQKSPEINSVWFARMQETYKVLAFTEANRCKVDKLMLSSGFAGFRTRKMEFLPFLYLSVNNDRFHKEKDRFCNGATQRSLTDSGLKYLQILTPTEDVVRALDDFVAPFLDQILTLQMANEKLSDIRDLLLPKLMKDEIDTSGFRL